MLSLLQELIEAILAKDPAAKSRLEIVLCYPGFHIMIFHGIAHWLWLEKMSVLSRLVSHLGRVFTGIEIHPGATIGRRVFIDHGMGVVIGETAEVGDDVVLYQGCTLGAGEAARQGPHSRGKKRHPTLKNRVIVGSGAEIQGDITIGENVKVASGSIVLKDIPANSIVAGVPGRIIYQNGQRVNANYPDIGPETIKELQDTIESMREEILQLKQLIAQPQAAFEKNPLVPAVRASAEKLGKQNEAVSEIS